MIRVILPAIALFILLAGGGGLFVLYTHLQGKQTTISLNGNNENVSAGGTALRMMFENATGQVTKTPDIDLRGHVPQAPAGWTARPYVQADGEAIVEAELIKTMVSKSTTNNILLDYRRSDQAGAGGETQTFVRDDRLMAFRMHRLEQLNRNTVQGQLLGEVSDNMSIFADLEPNHMRKQLFAKLDGIEVYEHPRFSRRPSTGDLTPVNYRRFTASLGGYVEFEIITNASDVDVAALLGQIDMAALNALLPRPAPDFVAGVGLHTAREVLADLPPAKSVPRMAYEVLKDGKIYSAIETQLLEDMAEGETADWDAMVERWGYGFEVPPIVQDLLGPMPDHVSIRYTAQGLLQEEAGLSPVEKRIVDAIARGRIGTQAEAMASRHYTANLVKEQTQALIAMLPEGTPVAVQEPEQQPEPIAAVAEPVVPIAAPAAPAAKSTGEKPVVRRGLGGSSMPGAGCKIEDGVRRCVLTGG